MEILLFVIVVVAYLVVMAVVDIVRGISHRRCKNGHVLWWEYRNSETVKDGLWSQGGYREHAYWCPVCKRERYKVGVIPEN